ncbi:MAG TPA: PLP-dependent aminotransferase family protein [Gaiellaceae bacterium]|jgi:DNA-binding transcriptional MocR family regulator|nr:PLP-dependent aminotransferase family protein [Gaiellaceae bacterium]
METISFAGEGLHPELLPASKELADCAGTALAEDGKRILSYGTGAGYTPLRELVAEQHGVHPFRVLVTNGWLQGLALVADRLARSASVAVEYPTYDEALRLLFGVSASMLYIDWSEEGLGVEAFEATMRVSGRPSFAYLMPTFQNPTGMTMSEDDRWALGKMFTRTGTPMLEDDTYGLLRFEGEPNRTLFELSEKTCMYSTSYSLTIAPGLRVGVFILPDDLAGELATKANSIYISPALLSQATVFEFIRRGSFAPHLEQLTAKLKERRDTLTAALSKHLPEAGYIPPEGGIFLFLRLPVGTNAKAVLERADGVTARAAEPGLGLPHTLRLNFAEPALDEIEAGVERLAAAFHEPAPETSGDW